MGRLLRASLHTRLVLVSLLALVPAGAAVTVTLLRSYNQQLTATSQDRIESDIVVFRAQLDQMRMGNLRLTSLMADNPALTAAVEAHDTAGLEKVLGPLRNQVAPQVQVLAAVDLQGATPFVRSIYAIAV